MQYSHCIFAVSLMVAPLLAQDVQPYNEVSNSYVTVTDFFKLPEGRKWGATGAIDVDRDGKSIWIAERCGANGCLDRATGKMSDLDPILKFDSTGKLVKSFGAGLIVSPHGIYVDRDDNIWITDAENAPGGGGGRGGGRGGSGAGGRGGGGAQTAPAPAVPGPAPTVGNQVFKFSPEGKLLLTLGTPGGAAAPGYFMQPNDVVTSPNGDIFVSEGHGGPSNRVLKFDKTGKFIKEWGKLGSAPGEFDQPHALAIDSRNRLYVGDRGNNRIQIFDLDGTYLGELRQFSRAGGLFITKDDMIYVSDSESGSSARDHADWKRGIRWGSLKDGKVIGFIPDSAEKATSTSGAEGVAVDDAGNIYGAEVGQRDVKKYVKK